MSLFVYNLVSPGVYAAISVDNDQTNPITTVHHGRNGDIFETKLFLGREDEDTHTYSNIQLTPVTLNSDQDIDPGSPGTGWGVKVLLDTGHDPVESEWSVVNYGAAIIFADITTDAKIPFWYRIESPRNISIQNKRNIALRVTFTETT